jgi:F0F1-type ATP synthase assembly protein I
MLLVGAGFEFTAVIGVLTLLGWWLDGRWGTTPGLLLTGLAIGFVGGIYKLYRTGKRFFR